MSILITSYQRSHLLKWNLYSLLRQNIPFPFEVIVLNDGLPDDTENLCRQFKRTLNLKYVFTGQRNKPEEMKYRVPGFALNIGARISKGDVLIISCAEMFHLNDTIRFLTIPVRIKPKLLATPVGMDDQDGSFLNYVNQYKGNFNQAAFNNDYPKLNTSLPFLMAINRREFFDIGGYDEDFTGLAFDDNDLVDRLIQNKCELCLTQAQTIHLYHPRYDTGKDQIDDYIYNKNLYQQRKGEVIRNQGKVWGKIQTG
ncbi:MAG: glycosyltransferase [Syntrophomonadaceae bacterium]|nr:glycosyltransferase [Syntrophomonadaceae bacterium]